MRKTSPIAFSFFISICISFIFLLITFWIFYRYTESIVAAKEALNTAGNYFGAIATLGAAIIAAFLYTDWKKPIFLERISSEQNEIIKLTRVMKRKFDLLLFFLKTKSPSSLTGLNNGDIFSLEYQKLVNDILDDMDDLAGLLHKYKYNFKESIPHEKNHLNEVTDSGKELYSIYDILANPNPILGYIESYKKVKEAVDSNTLQKHFKEIIKQLPKNLSAYNAFLIR